MYKPIFVFLCLNGNLCAEVTYNTLKEFSKNYSLGDYYSVMDLDFTSQLLTKKIYPKLTIKNLVNPEKYPSLINYLMGSCEVEDIVYFLKDRFIESTYSNILYVFPGFLNLDSFQLIKNRKDLSKKLEKLVGFLSLESEVIFVNQPIFLSELILNTPLHNFVYLIPVIDGTVELKILEMEMEENETFKQEHFTLLGLVSFSSNKDEEKNMGHTLSPPAAELEKTGLFPVINHKNPYSSLLAREVKNCIEKPFKEKLKVMDFLYKLKILEMENIPPHKPAKLEKFESDLIKEINTLEEMLSR